MGDGQMGLTRFLRENFPGIWTSGPTSSSWISPPKQKQMSSLCTPRGYGNLSFGSRWVTFGNGPSPEFLAYFSCECGFSIFGLEWILRGQMQKIHRNKYFCSPTYPLRILKIHKSKERWSYSAAYTKNGNFNQNRIFLWKPIFWVPQSRYKPLIMFRPLKKAI